MAAYTITDLLNYLNNQGVFSYVIPFLLIFAVIFAILEKSKILGDNKTIQAIVATSIGLLALQFDHVPRFFGVIFPRFGIGLSIFLVLLIMLGFFYSGELSKGKVAWIGWVVGIGVVLWSLSSYDEWFGDFGGWFSDYIYAIIILGAIVAVIIITSKSGKGSSPKPASGGSSG
jgi:hypothetical protein